MEHIHKDFLVSHANYNDAILFWEHLFEHAIRFKNQMGLWKFHSNFVYNNGETFFDGNPICALTCDEKHRSIRIIQNAPVHLNLFVIAWTKAKDVNESADTDELTISCELSDEASVIICRLIESWIDDKTTLFEMNEIIKKLV
jgi:hypothetical protein